MGAEIGGRKSGALDEMGALRGDRFPIHCRGMRMVCHYFTGRKSWLSWLRMIDNRLPQRLKSVITIQLPGVERK